MIEIEPKPMEIPDDSRSTVTHDRPFAVPRTVLDSLAGRFRASGIFLMALHVDGSVAWQDSSAGTFFQRYVVPLVERRLAIGLASSTNIQGVIPGIRLAVIPHIDKRQHLGAILVAARDEFFELSEELLAACHSLELSSVSLQQLAIELTGHDDASFRRHERMIHDCLRDLLRLHSMEAELTSISEQLAGSYEELTLIYQVSSGMKVNRGAADFFKQTCQDVLPVIGARGVGVALHSDFSSAGVPVIYGDLNLDPPTVRQLGQELLAMFQSRKNPMVLNDLSAQTRMPWLAEHANQLLAVPMQRYDKTFGCLFALDKEAGEFDSIDAKLLTSIANESAIYLENAQLFEDVHGLMMGLLHSLTSAVDAKDAYTCGHSERVALLARHLAQRIGLSDREVEQVYMAGLLHDVGKIGVPESVLQKAGRLTPEEFEQMKKHPEIGARILQDVRQVRDLIPGVLHHHERFDGRGYPTGLAGQDIPLMGRIICLADSFDAMTSNRTYRQALPLEVAMAEIRRCSGTHFDPGLAETFLHTAADHYRDLLHNHQEKSKQFLNMHDVAHIRRTPSVSAA